MGNLFLPPMESFHRFDFQKHCKLKDSRFILRVLLIYGNTVRIKLLPGRVLASAAPAKETSRSYHIEVSEVCERFRSGHEVNIICLILINPYPKSFKRLEVRIYKKPSSEWMGRSGLVLKSLGIGSIRRPSPANTISQSLAFDYQVTQCQIRLRYATAMVS